jgi:hypothetical protein
VDSEALWVKVLKIPKIPKIRRVVLRFAEDVISLSHDAGVKLLLLRLSHLALVL